MGALSLASKNEKGSVQDVEYLRLPDFSKGLKSMYNAGAKRKKIAEKVQALLARVGDYQSPLTGMKVTNHGEKRIKHCVKYDLGDGYRLVTIQHQKVCAFCFVGGHDDTDKWLRLNSGLSISKDSSGRLIKAVKSIGIGEEKIRRETDLSEGGLIERLGAEDQDILLATVPPSVLAQLYSLDSETTDHDIAIICEKISDVGRHLFVYDVMCLLLAGDLQKALRRIGIETGQVKALEDLSSEEFLEIVDGEEVKRIVVGSQDHADFLTHMAKTTPYLEWLLFLHPEQERVVEENFSGPAQLSGVSGSGKTCVAVKRAIRLARGGQNVMIVTLNRSLSDLIHTIVEYAAPDEETRFKIHTTSFFELCQDLLKNLRPEDQKSHNDISLVLEEHVDEVFREYYRGWLNFDRAKVMWPIHKSLSARGISSENYMRQEFDWIRSVLPPSRIKEYLSITRTGRKYPLMEDNRKFILEGLDGWQEKMQKCGVIDYLGLTTEVSRHISDIEPNIDAIIVDEAQDFGTTELAILRRLAIEGENDIFLCGDVAQHVLPKHRSLPQAGIEIGKRSRRIRRNYRNSREILRAAYEILLENLDETLIDDTDLEILDPEYANRSSPKPLVLKADALEDEYAYARSLLEHDIETNPDHKNCIAFAGFSLREIELFAGSEGLMVLNGMHSNVSEPIVLSDLEQTKGYEFNVVVVLNCKTGVLPPKSAPEEEAFRFGCQLYVAMTRARDELYLSHSGDHSEWLEKVRDHLNFAAWSEVMEIDSKFKQAKPLPLYEFESAQHERREALKLNGRQFLYTSWALGLSPEAQEKIVELVDGTGKISTQKKGRVKWIDMDSLRHDLDLSPHAKQLFGARVQLEVRELLSMLAR